MMAHGKMLCGDLSGLVVERGHVNERVVFVTVPANGGVFNTFCIVPSFC